MGKWRGWERCFGFHEFEDCQAGSRRERDAAFKRNQKRRGLMAPYVNRWAQAAALALMWLQILEQARAPMWAQALLGVAFSLAVPIVLVQAVGWLMLGAFKE